MSGLGRCPVGGHGNPLQYSCLENPMDREACWATVNGAAKSWTRLSMHTVHKHAGRIRPGRTEPLQSAEEPCVFKETSQSRWLGPTRVHELAFILYREHCEWCPESQAQKAQSFPALGRLRIWAASQGNCFVLKCGLDKGPT